MATCRRAPQLPSATANTESLAIPAAGCHTGRHFCRLCASDRSIIWITLPDGIGQCSQRSAEPVAVTLKLQDLAAADEEVAAQAGRCHAAPHSQRLACKHAHCSLASTI